MAHKQRVKIAATLVGMAALFVAMTVIVIQTDKGDIKVVSYDPSIEVTIKRNGEVVDNFEVKQRDGAASYFSGEYEIEIKGGNPDGVSITNEQFKLTRGKDVIVEITRELSVNAQSDSVHGDGNANGTAAWQPGPADNALPGLIPRPATFPGIKRWQIETALPRTMISAGAYSPDGRFIACGSNAGQVHIYDAELRRMVDVFTEHEQAILSVAWSPDNQWLAASGGKDRIHLWHVADQRWTSMTLDGASYSNSASSISWTPDSTRFAIANANAIDILDLTGRKQKSLRSSHARVVAWSPDGEILVGGSENGNLQVWTTADFTPGPVLESPPKIRCIDWSPDSQRFATGDNAGTIQIWHRDGTPAQTLEPASRHAINSLAWSPQGNKLVTAGVYIKVHDLEDDSKSVSPPEYQGNVAGLSWHPDGTHFVSFNENRLIQIWNSDGTRRTLAKGHLGDAKHVRWSHDGQILASSESRNGRVHLWTAKGMTQTVIKGYAYTSLPISWHPNDQKLAIWGADASFEQRDARGKHEATLIPPSDFAAWSAAWSPDEKQFAIGHDNNGVIEIWEPGRKRLAELKSESQKQITSIEWSPASHLLASASSNGIMRIWNVDAKSYVETKLAGQCYCAAWNPAGDRVAVSGRNTSLVTPDGTQVGELRGLHYSVDWSPDGQRLATANHDRTVDLWSNEGFPQAVLKAHDEIVEAVDWNPNGSLIASSSRDSTVIVWDAETNEAVWVGVQLDTGDSATFSAAGEVLDGSPEVIEEHFVYLVENEDGSRELLKPSDFQKRIQPERATTATDPHRALAEWVLAHGGSVDVRHGEQLDKSITRRDDLPTERFTTEGIRIDGVTAFGDDELGQLAKLRRAASGMSALDLFGISVTDAGLHHLEGLELQKLDFSLTPVSDAGLESLQKVSGLTYLALGGTQVTSHGMKTIAQIQGLRSLNLHSTTIDDDGLKELQRLPNLQTLILTETKVTDGGLEFLVPHQNLTYLQLIKCNVGDLGMKHLRNLTDLTILELQWTKVTDAGLKTLSPLTKLKHLALNGCDVSDDSLGQIGEWFPNLEDHLSIQSTNAGDGALKSIGQLEKLKVLYANSTRITDAGLEHLENLTHLEFLDVNQTQITEAAIQRLHAAIPQCRIEWDGGVIEPKTTAN